METKKTFLDTLGDALTEFRDSYSMGPYYAISDYEELLARYSHKNLTYDARLKMRKIEAEASFCLQTLNELRNDVAELKILIDD